MIYIFFLIVWGVIWGCATNAVIRNKGYDENWFVWGFFFGFIALIVACTKPEKKKEPVVYNPMYAKAAMEGQKKRILENGGWTCICGEVNPQIVTTCKCGRTKATSDIEKQKERMEKISKEIDQRIAMNAQQKDNGISAVKQTDTESDSVHSAEKEMESKAEIETEDKLIKVLKDYKELLDSGIITQAEFEAKKKQLLE